MESSLSPNIKNFEQNYQTHLKRLKLNGMQPKTIGKRSLPPAFSWERGHLGRHFSGRDARAPRGK